MGDVEVVTEQEQAVLAGYRDAAHWDGTLQPLSRYDEPTSGDGVGLGGQVLQLSLQPEDRKRRGPHHPVSGFMGLSVQEAPVGGKRGFQPKGGCEMVDPTRKAFLTARKLAPSSCSAA